MDRPAMEIRVSQEEDAVVVEAHGRLDELASPEFERATEPLAEKDGVRVVLDLAGVEYVSSGGLRAILSLHRSVEKRGGTLRLCTLSPFVTEVFEISGLAPLFAVYSTRQGALAAFTTG